MAVLVGPDAPLVINMKTRASYACDVWDFFKPDMSSEYPRVSRAKSELVTRTCVWLVIAACGYRGGVTAYRGLGL